MNAAAQTGHGVCPAAPLRVPRKSRNRPWVSCGSRRHARPGHACHSRDDHPSRRRSLTPRPAWSAGTSSPPSPVSQQPFRASTIGQLFDELPSTASSRSPPAQRSGLLALFHFSQKCLVGTNGVSSRYGDIGVRGLSRALEPVMFRLPSTGSPACRCSHARQAHEHYRRGSDCAFCGPQTCGRFRRDWRHRHATQVPVLDHDDART